VDVIHGHATVTGPTEVTVSGSDGGARRIETRTVLLTTGSRPTVPAIPGLAEAGFEMSETFFERTEAPRSMVMIGGGPISMELAQACNRLGVEVTVLQKGDRLLPRDEPSLVSTLVEQIRREGVTIVTDVETTSVTVDDSAATKTVHGTVRGVEHRWTAEEIFVGAGRTPNVEGLGLEALGITTGPRGIEVDARGRTAVKSIYAAGDVAGRFLFTHAAGYEGVMAVRDAFFPGSGKVGMLIPWCTFTDPELAHVGMTIAEAEARFGNDADVWRIDLDHNDRARADGTTVGSIVVVTGKGKVVGGHILGPSAGEMIHELALAVRHAMAFTDIASLVHVYPTLSTGIGQLAAESNFDRARRLRWLVKKG
jgi:pyruvate/2-oxoglutarate dehydrogenase complex dihydrolipoamide dehydrogenase (E3) component